MKVSINAGHTLNGYKGSGAVYNGFSESDITRAVANELMSILERKGHKVYNSTINTANSQHAYLQKAVALVNNTNVDWAISLHCNSSTTHSGNGAEIWTWNGKEYDEAEEILNWFDIYGFKNRGIKRGNNLYFVKNTKPKSMLIEMFFLDNEKDRKLYQELGHKQLARMIYYGLCE